MQSISTVASLAQPHPDLLYTWEDRSTPELERYELRWQTVPCRNCHGVVQRVMDYYYAYIEVCDGTRIVEQWARELFQTVGEARAWVQDHIVS